MEQMKLIYTLSDEQKGANSKYQCGQPSFKGEIRGRCFNQRECVMAQKRYCSFNKTWIVRGGVLYTKIIHFNMTLIL